MLDKKNIPEKTKKKIFQEANSVCPFCNENDVTALEIHHIYERAQGGDNEPENLLLVCANCHSKITYGEISKSEVIRKKYMLMGKLFEMNPVNKSGNSVNVSDSVNTGIIANTVNIKTNQKSKPKMSYPVDSIGYVLIKRNYVKYLIDRYKEYKKADKKVGNFKYAIIYNAIKREFKANWDYVPETRFEELVFYLQNRIDKTILGRTQKSRNHKNYESFEEYVERNG